MHTIKKIDSGELSLPAPGCLPLKPGFHIIARSRSESQ